MIHKRGDYFAIHVYVYMPLNRTYGQLDKQKYMPLDN